MRILLVFVHLFLICMRVRESCTQFVIVVNIVYPRAELLRDDPSNFLESYHSRWSKAKVVTQPSLRQDDFSTIARHFPAVIASIKHYYF